MATTGRPRAYNLNAAALQDLMVIRGIPQTPLSRAAEISPPTLNQALRQAKGLSEPVIERIARILGVNVATIAPELAAGAVQFHAVREGDAGHIPARRAS